MPKYFEVSGPAAVVLSVRDTAAAAEFYEKLLGFRRDPEVSPNGGVGFLTRPSSFAVIQAPPGVDLECLHRPIRAPAIWFKTSDSQVAHDALVEAGVTILRPPSDGRFGRQFTRSRAGRLWSREKRSERHATVTSQRDRKKPAQKE